MGRLSLILMSFLNEGRISASDERVVEGEKLDYRFLFNDKIIKLLSSLPLYFFYDCMLKINACYSMLLVISFSLHCILFFTLTDFTNIKFIYIYGKFTCAFWLEFEV